VPNISKLLICCGCLILGLPSAAAGQEDWGAARQSISVDDDAPEVAPEEEATAAEPDDDTSEGTAPEPSVNEEDEPLAPAGPAVHTGRDDQFFLHAAIATFGGKFEHPLFGSSQGFVISPHAEVGYVFRDRLRFVAGWHLLLAPFLSVTRADGSEEEGLELGLGNPYLAGSYRLGDLWVGGALYVPLADQGPFERMLGMGTHGARPWAWLPDHITMLGTIDWATRLTPEFRLRLEGAGGIAFALDDSDLTSFALEGTAEFSYALSAHFRVHAAAHLAYNDQLVLDEFDSVQFAVRLGASWRSGSLRFRLDLSLPIDDPLGFAFASDGVFGLKLGVLWGS